MNVFFERSKSIVKSWLSGTNTFAEHYGKSIFTYFSHVFTLGLIVVNHDPKYQLSYGKWFFPHLPGEGC